MNCVRGFGVTEKIGIDASGCDDVGGIRGSSTVIVTSSSSSISSTTIISSGVVGLFLPRGIPRYPGVGGEFCCCSGVKMTVFGCAYPDTFLSAFLKEDLFAVEGPLLCCADLAVTSLNNHPVIVFPKCCVTRET